MASNAVLRQVPVSLKDLNIATGTWTHTNASGLLYMLKTATDETSTITFTLPMPRHAGQHGVKLKKVLVPLRVITANLDAAPTCAIYRNDFDLVVAGATGDATTTTIATTNDGVVTADANDRLLTITVSSPDWDYATEAQANYTCSIALNCAASTVVRLYPPIVEFEELV